MATGIFALLFANIIGGSISALFVKLGVQEIPPITFTVLRYLIALFIILPVYLKNPLHKISGQNFKWLFLSSLFFTVNVALFAVGIQYTNVLISQILYSFMPVIVGFLAHFILKEKITIHRILGSAIAFCGLAFLVLQSFGNQQLTFGTSHGNLIILMAVFSWAFYIIYSKKAAASVSEIGISFANFLITVVLLLVFLPFELSGSSFSFSSISPLGLVSLLVTAVFSSVIYVSLLQIGIKKAGAFIASLFSYTAPFFAAATAIPFLGEKITLNFVLGGVLIMAGVFFATTYPKIRGKI